MEKDHDWATDLSRHRPAMPIGRRVVAVAAVTTGAAGVTLCHPAGRRVRGWAKCWRCAVARPTRSASRRSAPSACSPASGSRATPTSGGRSSTARAWPLTRRQPDPTRQVHLIHSELHDKLRARGFDVAPGQMGENVTTRGVELLALPVGTLLRLGAEAVVEVTGLRNPCIQLDAFRPGLMAAVLGCDPSGRLVRKAGIMTVVRIGGVVRPGGLVTVEFAAMAAGSGVTDDARRPAAAHGPQARLDVKC